MYVVFVAVIDHVVIIGLASISSMLLLLLTCCAVNRKSDVVAVVDVFFIVFIFLHQSVLAIVIMHALSGHVTCSDGCWEIGLSGVAGREG